MEINLKKLALLSLVLILMSLVMFGCGTKKLQVVKVSFDDAPSEAGIILGDKLEFFEQQGIKIEYIKFNSDAEELAAIASNQVDISRVNTNSDLFNAFNKGSRMKIVADGGHNTDKQIAVLLYSQEFDRKSDLGKKFMVGYIKGVRAYNDALVEGDKDQEKIIDILTDNTLIDQADLIIKMNLPSLFPNGDILKEDVIRDQKLYLSKGLVKTEANVDQLVTTSYIDYANAKIGKYQKSQ
ncbi:MAG: ABC transporter substrate-binding protein [Carboxydocellales bacterium]